MGCNFWEILLEWGQCMIHSLFWLWNWKPCPRFCSIDFYFFLNLIASGKKTKQKTPQYYLLLQNLRVSSQELLFVMYLCQGLQEWGKEVVLGFCQSLSPHSYKWAANVGSPRSSPWLISLGCLPLLRPKSRGGGVSASYFGSASLISPASQGSRTFLLAKLALSHCWHIIFPLMFAGPFSNFWFLPPTLPPSGSSAPLLRDGKTPMDTCCSSTGKYAPFSWPTIYTLHHWGISRLSRHAPGPVPAGQTFSNLFNCFLNTVKWGEHPHVNFKNDWGLFVSNPFE